MMFCFVFVKLEMELKEASNEIQHLKKEKIVQEEEVMHEDTG
jgi:hypothetical protein